MKSKRKNMHIQNCIFKYDLCDKRNVFKGIYRDAYDEKQRHKQDDDMEKSVDSFLFINNIG